MRTLIGCAFFVAFTREIAFCTMPPKSLPSISWHALVFLALLGFATGASWLFYFKALQLGDASKVAPVDKLSVAITILLSVVVLGEPLSCKTLVGGLLIVAGSLVLALQVRRALLFAQQSFVKFYIV